MKSLAKLYFIFFLNTLLCANEILYIMPYEQKQALNHLLSLLQGAKENINISIYSFTNREIAKALRNVAKRGVSVNLIYDLQSNQDNPKSTIGYLSKYKNIQTCLLGGLDNGKFNGLMHQKMAIIDNQVLVLGSANWSKSAFKNNYETLFFTSNPNSIQKAQKAFMRMFKACTPF